MNPTETAQLQNVTIASRGLDLAARLFVPAAATGAAPGVVLLHDIEGPNDFAHESAARLSALGYVTIAPDLFTRTGPPPDLSEPALMQFALGMSDSQNVGDAVAAAQWLAQRPDVQAGKIGIIGWGWGGACALMAGASEPRLSAVIDIGGAISYPVLTPGQPGSPLNFIADIEAAVFAAYPDSDPRLPPAEVARLRRQLEDHDKHGEVKVYHDTRARFWTDAALPQTALLWRRIEQFLHDHLVAPEEADDALGGYPNEESRLHA